MARTVSAAAPGRPPQKVPNAPDRDDAERDADDGRVRLVRG